MADFMGEDGARKAGVVWPFVLLFIIELIVTFVSIGIIVSGFASGNLAQIVLGFMFLIAMVVAMSWHLRIISRRGGSADAVGDALIYGAMIGDGGAPVVRGSGAKADTVASPPVGSVGDCAAVVASGAAEAAGNCAGGIISAICEVIGGACS